MEEKGVKSEEDGGSGVMESEMLEEKSVRESESAESSACNSSITSDNIIQQPTRR
jgi:hypothetical protein